MAKAPLGDLFEPVIAEERFHPYFRRVLRHGSTMAKNVLRNWAEGLEDRDGKFVQEFQSSFNSSFWELYIFACLKNLGVQLDTSHAAPDFIVDGATGPLALEAVVALSPQGLAPDWVQHGPPTDVDMELLLDLASLRLAQSVHAKSAKWLNSYALLPHCSGRAYVICIAPFEQPYAQLQGTRAMTRVLFGEPRRVLLKDETTTAVVGAMTLAETFKPSGASVQLGLFRSDGMPHVSGVLFSSLATWSKVTALAAADDQPVVFHSVRLHSGKLYQEVSKKADYREDLMDGLHLFVNPFATCPLSLDLWRRAGLGIHRMERSDCEPVSELPDGLLITRTPWRASSSRSHPPGEPSIESFPPHQKAKPKDGTWFGGPATLGFSDSVYLMLHDGWTICVGRDVYDDDWQFMLKRGTFLSLQAFVDGGDPEMVEVSFATQQGALTAAFAAIANASTSRI